MPRSRPPRRQDSNASRHSSRSGKQNRRRLYEYLESRWLMAVITADDQFHTFDSQTLEAGQSTSVYWAQSEAVDGENFRSHIERWNFDPLLEPERLFTQPGLVSGMAAHAEERAIVWTESGRIARYDVAARQLDFTTASQRYGVAIDPETGIGYYGSPNGLRRGTEGDTAPLVPGGLVYAVAVNPSLDIVYWHDENLSAIRRANLDGTHVETIVPNVPFIVQFAIDPSTGNLYWPDFSANTIRSAAADGSDIRTVVIGSRAVTVNIDTRSGLLYWYDLGTSTFQRMPLAGGPVEQVLMRTSAPTFTLLSERNDLFVNDQLADAVSPRAMLDQGPANGELTLRHDGTFTYTPRAGFVGEDFFVYSIIDGSGMRSNASRVTIRVDDGPPTGVADEYTIVEDTQLTTQAAAGVLANDHDRLTATLTATLERAPQRGRLTRFDADGSFQYEPLADFFGVDTFAYRVSDGSRSSGPVTVSIVVTPQSEPPRAVDDFYRYLDGDMFLQTGTNRAGTEPARFAEMEPNDRFDTAQVFEGERFSLAADSQIGNASEDTSTRIPHVTIEGTGDGTFDYYLFDVLRAGAVAIFDIDATVNLDSYLRLYDEQGNLLDQNDDSSTTNGGAGSTSNLDSYLEYTFAAPGRYWISVGSCCVSAVTPGSAYHLHISLDQPLPGLLNNDVDPDGDSLQIQLVDRPSLGSLELQANGHFLYTPRPNVFGTDTFTYRLHDGLHESNIATVLIELIDVNQIPTAANDHFTLDEDGVLQVSTVQGVLANDRDGEGETLAALLLDRPEHGTLALQEDGSFVYTPAADFFGTDHFRYQATDGIDQSAPAVVTIVVSPVADAPRATGDLYRVAADHTLSAASDVDRRLFWGTTSGLVEQFHLDGATRQTIASDRIRPQQLAWDPDSANVYWTDAESRTVRRANLTTGEQQIIIQSAGRVHGLVVAAGLSEPSLFWTNIDENAIYRANLDGTHSRPIVVAEAPFKLGVSLHDLAIDEGAGKLYWINRDRQQIERSNVDGTEREVLFEGLNDPTDLAIDHIHEHMYIYDSRGTIERGGLEGGDRQIVLADRRPIHGLDVDPHAGKLYWSENAIDILRADLDGSDVEVVQSRVAGIQDLVIDRSRLAGVLANDVDVDGRPISAVLVERPVHGELEFGTSGHFYYRPAPAFVGTDSFTYRMQAGAAVSELATVTIHVENGVPLAEDDRYLVGEDHALIVTAPVGVLANDRDAGGSLLQAVLVDRPRHGELRLADDGSFYYQTEADFFGTDSFTYQARDPQGLSRLSTVMLQVVPLADPVTPQNDTYTILAGESLDAATDQHRYAYVTDRTSDRVLKLHLDGSGRSELLATPYPQGAEVEYDVERDQVYWSNTLRNNVLRVNADGSELTTVAEIAGPSGIALLPGEELIVISLLGTNERQLVRMRRDGSRPAPIASGVITTVHAEFDPVTQQVYWAETNTGRIRRSNLDGSGQETVLLGLREPAALALDTLGRTMVWFDRSDDLIYTANLDGSQRRVLVRGFVNVSDLEIDPLAGKLYITDRGSDLVQRVGLDGSQLQTLVSGVDPFGIGLQPARHAGVLRNDIDPDLDPRSLRVELVQDVQHGVLRLNTDGTFFYTPADRFAGTDRFQYRVLREGVEARIGEVNIDVQSRLPQGVADRYEVDEDRPLDVTEITVLANDLDPQGMQLTAIVDTTPRRGELTLSEAGAFRYVPRPHFFGEDTFTYVARAADGRTSVPVEVTIMVRPQPDPPVGVDDHYVVSQDQVLEVDVTRDLLWTDTRDDVLGRARLDGTGAGPLLEFSQESQARDLVWSAQEKRVYWLDRGTGAIYRARPDGTERTAVVTRLSRPAGLAIDDQHGFLYWADTQQGTLRRANLAGTTIETVLAGLEHPVAVDVDPRSGRIYWADSVRKTIESIDADGNGRRTWLSQLDVPIDITIDDGGERLYYTDSSYGEIGSIDLDTGHPQILVRGASGVRGVDVDPFARRIYWTNSMTGTLHRAALDGTDPEIVLANLQVPWGVLVLPSQSLLANDFDIDRGAISLDLVTSPLHGNLQWQADGSFVYTPNVGYVGTDRFTYRPRGALVGNETVVTLEVTATPMRTRADVNRDGTVDALDFAELASRWGAATDRVFGDLADLNGDGTIDSADAGWLFAEWTGDELARAVG